MGDFAMSIEPFRLPVTSEPITDATLEETAAETSRRPGKSAPNPSSETPFRKSVEPEPAAAVKIKVCGVGGGGCNAITRMRRDGLRYPVEFIAINTDRQQLRKTEADFVLEIGKEITHGLGAGAHPDRGRQAAEASRQDIHDYLTGGDLIFLTAGLGGGTGTGALPVVAEEAHRVGALTVAVVTLPFSLEKEWRMQLALQGLRELYDQVDTLLVIPNDRLFEFYGDTELFLDCFKYADEVLLKAVRGITDLLAHTGVINVDFADLRTIMSHRGRAIMGIGVGEGKDRALQAVRSAVVCPLLDRETIKGASAVIVNISASRDTLTNQEVRTIMSEVQAAAHPGAKVIFGLNELPAGSSEIQVTVIATGFVDDDVHHGRMQYSPHQIPPSGHDVRTEHAALEREYASSDMEPEYEEVVSPESSVREDKTPARTAMLFEEEASSTAATEANGYDEDLDLPTWLRQGRRQRNGVTRELRETPSTSGSEGRLGHTLKDRFGTFFSGGRGNHSSRR